MSGRPGIAEKRLSAHRFQQIPDYDRDTMNNPNDVTINIPLSSVTSRGQTGARNNSISPSAGYAHSAAEAANDGEKAAIDDSTTPASSNVLGFRRRKVIDEATGRSLDDPEDGTITRMGRIYQAVLNFSFVTRYMIYVAPVALIIAIPIIVGATAAQDAKIGGVTLPWFFTWIEVIWVSLWVSKAFARVLPFVFQFLCGIVSSGTRKYALILRNLEIPITTVFWMLISLVTFLPIMTLNPKKKEENDTETKDWEKSVKNVLFALFVCSLIFLAQKAIIQLISISYHRKQFDARIKESKRNVYLIGVLYDASRNMFPMYCKEFRDDDAIISDSILASSAKPGHLRSSSSAPLRLIRNMGQNVDRIRGKMTAALGDVAHEITGRQVFNSAAARSIVSQALERRRASEALARRIWMSFVIEGREALYHDDIVEVLGAGKEMEAEESFLVLDRDGNGDISLEEMILAVSEIGRARKALNHSMHDVDQAIHVLDNLLATVAFIIALLVFVSFVTSGFGTVIAAGATSLLSLSFVFSTTAQEVLGSCVFLFVKHPFDIGDRVEIDSKPYIVERISLLFSVFRNVADHRVTQIPNVVLNTLWIDNFTRSNAMQEKLTIDVSFDTTFAEVQLIKDHMETFVRDKENSRDFQPDVDVDVVGVGSMDKLELTVSICHKSNWSIESVRAARRSKFMCALIAALRKIPIRAPGAAASEENPANDSDNDNNPGNQEQQPKRESSSTEGIRLSVPENSFTDSSHSTGFDSGRSGSIQRRAAATAAATGSAYSESTTLDNNLISRSTTSNDLKRRTRSPPGIEEFQTPASSPDQDRQLSVNYGPINRAASTGRRKQAAAQYSPTGPIAPVPPSEQPLSPSYPQPQLSPQQQQHQQQQHLPNPYSQQPYPSQFYDGPPQAEEYDPSQPLELPSDMHMQPPLSLTQDQSQTQAPSQPYGEYAPSASSVQSPVDPRFATDEQTRAYTSPRPYGA